MAGAALSNSVPRQETTPHAAPQAVTIAQALPIWARIAALSFGGPAGQIAVMHRILVEERRWISENRFLHALNFCTLLPGPEAQQLATYVGWLMHGTRGGLLAGGLFVLPGVVAIMALSWIYALYGNVGLVAGLFFGLKAAVLAIVAQAVLRIGRKALKSRVLVALAAASFVAIFFLDVPFPLIVLTAGVIGYFGGRAGLPQFRAGGGHGTSGKDDGGPYLLGDDELPQERPSHGHALRVLSIWGAIWLVPVALILVLLGPGNVFAQVALFFSQMAMVTFGGAYAVLAYVAQQAVDHYGWLQPGEMLDGLGMAETTPGPLIMVTQFVGFLAAYRAPGALPPLVAGTLGGLLTTWVTFAPCFLWISLGAPYVERLRGNRALAGALAAITAAVVGVILNLAVWFALHTIFAEVRPFAAGPIRVDLPVLASLNPYALLLAVAALVAVFRFKVGMILTLAACSATGMALHLTGLV
ncbi:chromate efflux transporter [Methylobacterium soli]|uniref:Chromate efflux transporter n=1 Tax=Methylobacterium soli TaxID=553447 RepID=A0A6L3SUV8_9HYPH|nr:chromate efflux transporter [Methylobacterium soli]KAB1077435.1 chromate efflux transporter [Methylobacterium soli]GJE45585.1 putative chromate transport protein [Methylobacterium soli]